MRIYLAARYGRHAELRAYAIELEALGHTVTSRWIQGEHEVLDEQLTELPEIAQRFAQDDLADLLAAQIICCFTESPGRVPGRARGGRHVEAGVVLGWNAAIAAGASLVPKELVVVGPAENVFYALPDVRRFPDWPAARAWFAIQS